MKYWWLGLCLLCFSCACAQSCCSNSCSSSWNILPNIQKHILGVRYTQRSFVAKYPQSLNPELTGKVTREQLHAVELFGRFNLRRNLQLSVFIPYNIIHRNERGAHTRVYSLGDIMFTIQQQVLPLPVCNGKVKQQLRIGAGIKLPSGNFDMTRQSTFNTSLQTGTGSVDFLVNAFYTLRYKKIGVNIPVSFKANTVNPQQFLFGHRLQQAVQFFYVATVNHLQLMPVVAVTADYVFQNVYRQQILSFTGGTFLHCSAGIDVYYKQLAFSASVSPAVLNRLNWPGESKSIYQAEVGIFYNF